MKGYKGCKIYMCLHYETPGGHKVKEEREPSFSHSLSFPLPCSFWMLNTSPTYQPPLPPPCFPHPSPPRLPPRRITDVRSFVRALAGLRLALFRPDHWPNHPPFKEVLGSRVHNKVTQLWMAGGILFQRAHVFTFPSLPLSRFSLHFFASPFSPVSPCIISNWPVSRLISIASQSEGNMKANGGGWAPV